MAARAHFSPRLFRFLRDLHAHNDREWFQANKERFEADLRRPLQRFVSDFGPLLAKISKQYVADPRPAGGSIFRIHRDTRFSKDKRPYKTWAAAQFRHTSGKDVHAPGFYLHLAPGEVFAGVGIWHPDGDTLGKIRAAIIDDPKAFRRITRAKKLTSKWQLSGDSLKRPPRGFDPEHPLIDDLKRKDFILVHNLSEANACKPDFLKTYAEACRAAAPFARWLTDAIDLEW